MMTQTLAIFHDAYRELNSKKLFWIVMAISALVIAVFASLGINQEGLMFLRWTIPSIFNTNLMTPSVFYKEFLFAEWGIKIWLTWIATVLALVSTAGLIPEFISSGSIELSLSKPIGRFRLFITKYMAGLMFVTLQVAAFSLGAFLVIGLRGKVWEPRIFLAIPIVVALFSYLYSICVLLGVLTRSTIASLLLTLLAWFFFFILHIADAGIIMNQVTQIEVRRDRLVQQIKDLEQKKSANDAKIAENKDAPEKTPAAPDEKAAAPVESNKELADALAKEQGTVKDQLAAAEKELKPWMLASRIAFGVKTLFPKTNETKDLLGRTLKTQAEIDKQKELESKLPNNPMFGGPEQRLVAKKIQEKLQSRSLGWVLGTSLTFEALVLLLAGFIFCRRDF
jgi:ABC-type transport system involved in multi-copper enzyme maturation permease subunit